MRIDYLDGIRGLLAVSVVISHVAGMITGWRPPWAFEGAYMAVDMFFILSGYVLTFSLLKRPINMGSFFWRRFWRLWPLHVAVLLGAVVIYEINRSLGRYAPEGSFSDPVLFLENAFFLMKLGIIEFPVINPPSYSIGIEFWVSALLVPWFVRMKPVSTFAIAGLCYLAVAYRWGGVSGAPTVAPFVNLGLVKGIAGMALGSAIFKIDLEYSNKLSTLDNSWIIAFYISVLLLISFALYGQTNSNLNFIVLALFGTTLISCFFTRSGFLCDVLSSPPLVWLGQMSFALYLVHMPLLVLIGVPQLAQQIGDYNAAVVSFLVCMAASALVYQLFDAPVEAFFKRKLSSKPNRLTSGTNDTLNDKEPHAGRII